MDNLIGTSNISFTSLRAKKQVGESVLRELRKELGHIESGTRLSYRRQSLEKTQKLSPSSPFSIRLSKKEDEINKICYDDFLLKKVKSEKFNSFDDFIFQLKANVKSKGNKGNCWEHMMFVYDKLVKCGETPYNIEIIVEDGEGFFRNHFTTVFGLKKGAKLNDPKTWGSKAMMVDAWDKMVVPAKEGIGRFITKMAGGEKNYEIVYYPILNPVKIKKSESVFQSIINAFSSQMP